MSERIKLFQNSDDHVLRPPDFRSSDVYGGKPVLAAGGVHGLGTPYSRAHELVENSTTLNEMVKLHFWLQSVAVSVALVRQCNVGPNAMNMQSSYETVVKWPSIVRATAIGTCHAPVRAAAAADVSISFSVKPQISDILQHQLHTVSPDTDTNLKVEWIHHCGLQAQHMRTNIVDIVLIGLGTRAWDTTSVARTCTGVDP